jgi:hypothetical protein
MNKTIAVSVVLLVCSLGRAQTMDRAADSATVVINPNDTITAACITARQAQLRPLGEWHLSLAPVGYAVALSPEYFRIPAWDIDCSKGTSFFLNYRQTRTPNVDLVFDLHGWRSSSSSQGLEVALSVAAIGFGARYTDNQLSPSIHPYVQATVARVIEWARVSGGGQSFSDNVGSFGFCVDVGAELRLSRLISIPVEVEYLYGKPGDDVSSVGVAAGISLNWDTVK